MTPMKNLLPISFFSLALWGMIATTQAEEEIILNSTQTPDEVGALYLDDLTNSGQVLAGSRERISFLDDNPGFNIGDVGNYGIPGRIRKVFLLFRLPDLQGKTVKRAVLNLHLSSVQQDGPATLPPLMLLHAKQWDADLWESDGPRRGLQLSDYGDEENFSTKMEVCGPGHELQSPLSIDVTEMIKSNYNLDSRPVAAFRLEVADQQSLEIGDDLYNFYVFVGPGHFSRPESTRPSLSLVVE